MAEWRLTDRRLAVPVAATLAVLGFVFLSLLPPTQAPGWPGPDPVLCLVLALVLRRPDQMPALLIAALLLFEDLMTLRPPGLWAAIVLGGTEILRDRARLSREVGFWAEWALVAGVICGAFAANRFVLALLLVPQPPIAPVAVEAAATVALYPLVVGVLRFGFGLRKPATGEVDARGRRL
jgi:rod shape-determining protein MreD